MEFYSHAKQDIFVANMLNFKQFGYYIDIGGANPINYNNTYAFENLGWKGICVEIDPAYNSLYISRPNTIYINQNALNIDYDKILSEYNFPNIIDYLSLDIDESSVDFLKIFPFNKFTFKVITVEHDKYLYGDIYKNSQIKILNENGYYLLCENVHAPGYYASDGSPAMFEDWWIYKSEFKPDLVYKIKSNNLHPDQIIGKFK